MIRTAQDTYCVMLCVHVVYMYLGQAIYAHTCNNYGWLVVFVTLYTKGNRAVLEKKLFWCMKNPAGAGHVDENKSRHVFRKHASETTLL